MKWLLSLSAVVALSSTLALAQTPITRAINKWHQQPRKDRRDFVERVKAGRRNARANGKRLGRPSRGVNAATVAKLRGQGLAGTLSPFSEALGSPRCIARREDVPKLGKRFWERRG